jgi:hypothetical protein
LPVRAVTDGRIGGCCAERLPVSVGKSTGWVLTFLVLTAIDFLKQRKQAF